MVTVYLLGTSHCDKDCEPQLLHLYDEEVCYRICKDFLQFLNPMILVCRWE